MKPFFVLTLLASLGTGLSAAVEVEKRDINAGAQALSPRAAFRAATRSEIKARDFFECSSVCLCLRNHSHVSTLP